MRKIGLVYLTSYEVFEIELLLGEVRNYGLFRDSKQKRWLLKLLQKTYNYIVKRDNL